MKKYLKAVSVLLRAIAIGLGIALTLVVILGLLADI